MSRDQSITLHCVCLYLQIRKVFVSLLAEVNQPWWFRLAEAKCDNLQNADLMTSRIICRSAPERDGIMSAVRFGLNQTASRRWIQTFAVEGKGDDTRRTELWQDAYWHWQVFHLLRSTTALVLFSRERLLTFCLWKTQGNKHQSVNKNVKKNQLLSDNYLGNLDRVCLLFCFHCSNLPLTKEPLFTLYKQIGLFSCVYINGKCHCICWL